MSGCSGPAYVCRSLALEWPPLPGRRRRAAPLTAALTLGAFAALPQSALAGVLAPDSPASPQAGATWTAYVVMAILATIVAIAVIVALLRAVRSGRGGSAEPERRTRGTAGVQRRVGFGLGAAVLVLFVVAVIFTESARDVSASESGADPITIQVDGQQWIWRYEYPEATDTSDGYSAETPFSFYELVVPVDTPVTLDVSSVDVLHRWWVPALGRAVDAVPGKSNEFTFVADEVGSYEGRSTEFSGPGYSTMRTVVRVVAADEYEAFLKERIAAIDEARDAVEDAVKDGSAPGVALEG